MRRIEVHRDLRRRRDGIHRCAHAERGRRRVGLDGEEVTRGELHRRHQVRAGLEDVRRKALDPGRHLGRRREPDLPFELEGEIARRRDALLRIGGERAHHDVVELGRDVRRVLAGRREVALDDARNDVDVLRGPVKPATGEHLPEHDRRGEHVGASVDLTADLLRRHVRELALDLALARDLRPTCRLRDTEVEHACAAVAADDHVLR